MHVVGSRLLSDHTYLVTVVVYPSDPLQVKSGVPPYSVLGPLLFLNYINNLSAATHLYKTLLFADDSKHLHTISQHQRSTQLQRDLDSLVSDGSREA